MENIAGQEFVKNFDEFYIELTLLNYIHRTKSRKFSERDIKTINYLKLIIPIFKRLQEEGVESLDLDKILNTEQFNIPVPIIQENNFGYYPNAQPSYNPIIRLSKDLPIDSDSDGYKNITTESEPESDSEDPEGDIKVNDITNRALELLSNIKKNNWTQVEPSSDEFVLEENDIDVKEIKEEKCPTLVKSNFVY